MQKIKVKHKWMPAKRWWTGRRDSKKYVDMPNREVMLVEPPKTIFQLAKLIRKKKYVRKEIKETA